MRIMITGAGGPAALCIIKSLKRMKEQSGNERKYNEIVATDTDSLASGLYLADKGLIAPYVSDKEFIKKMLELARKEKVSVIIPTVQEELIHFADNLKLFEKEGIVVIVSNSKSLKISNNKLDTYAFFKGEPFCPEIYERSNVKFPAVIKPFDSRGARGFYKVDNEDELRIFLAKNDRTFGKDNSLIMEYLPGTEYSNYGFSDLEGNVLVVVPVKRIQANGTSLRAQIVDNPKVEEIAKRIAKKLNLQGAWNIQLMEAGESIKLVEVNPRFAGTGILPDHAGVHLPHLAIKLFSGEKIEPNELKYNTGIFMTRFQEENFLGPEELIK